MIFKVKKIGVDDWGRNVYRNIETKRIYKDINNVNRVEAMYLHSCGNDFDGEPDCPIRSDVEIVVVEN